MPLIIERVTVRAAEIGEACAADLFRCDICNNETWVIFTIAGQTHPHLQCVECGTSFCFMGACT